jgi:glycosyltransferase involved in cell wall biosynthesis
MPKVTVVIAVLNGERFIGEALESVLDQTFQDFEIVVVDDGSTDGTADVVRQYRGSISYLHQDNQGVGQARNRGVSEAKGEWIAFLDADDVWYRNKLSVQIEYVQMCPDVGFFYSDMDSMDEKGSIKQTAFLMAETNRRDEKKRHNLVSLIFHGQPFPYPSTVLIKKDLFQKARGFNPLFVISNHEDFELFARIARISPLKFIPESLAKYRFHANQRTQDSSGCEANWPLLLNCLWKVYGNDPNKQQVLKSLQGYYAKYLSDAGKRWLRSGDYEKARHYFRQAFCYRPFNWKNVRRWGLSYVPGLRDLYVYQKASDHRIQKGGALELQNASNDSQPF